jgi:ATP-binding cassette subfamily A (ABC1) protein 3
LDYYVNTKAGNLSGGNKRKLCVADALIGGTSITFFDEPSTGVDPIARRFLFQTLKNNVSLRDSAVMMTTHTIEEAELLCDRLGILVKGQFVCLGSPEQLRK